MQATTSQPNLPVSNRFENFSSSVKETVHVIVDRIKKICGVVFPLLLGAAVAFTAMWMNSFSFSFGALAGFANPEYFSSKFEEIKKTWSNQNCFSQGAILVGAYFLAPVMSVVVPFAAGAYITSNAVQQANKKS